MPFGPLKRIEENLFKTQCQQNAVVRGTKHCGYSVVDDFPMTAGPQMFYSYM